MAFILDRGLGKCNQYLITVISPARLFLADISKTLSAIAMAMIFTRWIVRLRVVGIRGFQGDDLAALGVLTFTVMDAAVVTVAYFKGQNVSLLPSQLPLLTKADLARLEYGSKVELSAWFSYVSLIYALKFTMLFFYKRLTLGSLHGKLVRIFFWVVGIAYLANLLELTFGCYPIQMNWQVSPMPPWKCSYRPQNFIATAALNVFTDACLLAIPIPMLWKLKMPLRKKLIIGLILSSGVFVIVVAIIRLAVALGSAPSAASINRWGVRETFIACITVNVPILRPVFSGAFWRWGAYNPTAGSHNKSGNGHSQGHVSALNKSRMAQGDVDDWKGDIELGNTANISGNVPGQRDIVKKGMIMQTRIVETTDNDELNLLSDGSSSKSV